MSREGSPHLSTLALDKLRLKRLSPEEESQARSHLDQCPTCSQRLTMTTSSAEHFQQVVQQRTQERLRERLEQQQPSAPLARPQRRLALAAAGALLVLGLLAALLLLRG